MDGIMNIFDSNNNLDEVRMTYLIVFSVLMTIFLIVSFFFFVYFLCFRENYLTLSEDDSYSIPDTLQPKYQDPSNFHEDIKSFYHTLEDKEKIRFKLAYKFFQQNPPHLTFNNSSNEIDTTYLLIRDRGISCFYFENYQEQLSELIQNIEDEEQLQDGGDSRSHSQSQSQTQSQSNNDSHSSNNGSPLFNSNIVSVGGSTDVLVSETTSLLPISSKRKYTSTDNFNYRSLMFKNVPFYVEDLTEINFITNEMSSTTLNLPLPLKNRKNETVYFETKLFDFDPSVSVISIGLATDPYPNFQLPGLSPYSIGIQTDGTLRFSGKPFLNDADLPVVLPQLIEGDVIGIGYKSTSGSVFVTHNGKNILEIIKHLKVQLFPCIGSVGSPCKVSVNLGQLGFVFIEANVKKLGFCENQNEGTIGAPPFYSPLLIKQDPLLDQGEQLPPHYPSDEETFFGPKSLIEKASLLVKKSSVSSDAGVDLGLGIDNGKGRGKGKGTPDSTPPSYHSDEKDDMLDGEENDDTIVNGISIKKEIEDDITLTSGDYERQVATSQTPSIMARLGLDQVVLEGSSRNVQQDVNSLQQLQQQVDNIPASEESRSARESTPSGEQATVGVSSPSTPINKKKRKGKKKGKKSKTTF